MTEDQTFLIGMGGRRFGVVRKGYDTDEVRRYLTDLEGKLRSLPDPGEAPEPAKVVAAAATEAAEILAEARNRAGQLRREQFWSEPSAPDAETKARADEIVARAEAQAAEMRAEAVRSVDGFSGALDDHDLRIRTQAEAEAKAIVDRAREAAAARTEPLDASRAEVQSELAAAEVRALKLIGAAESDAANRRANARAEAESMVAARLREAEADRDAARAALLEARGSLTRIGETVAALLQQNPRPVADGPTRSAEPEPPEEAVSAVESVAPSESDPEAPVPDVAVPDVAVPDVAVSDVPVSDVAADPAGHDPAATTET